MQNQLKTNKFPLCLSASFPFTIPIADKHLDITLFSSSGQYLNTDVHYRAVGFSWLLGQRSFRLEYFLKQNQIALVFGFFAQYLAVLGQVG